MKASFIDCADLQLPGMCVSGADTGLVMLQQKPWSAGEEIYPAVQLRDNGFGAFIPLFQFLRRPHRGT